MWDSILNVRQVCKFFYLCNSKPLSRHNCGKPRYAWDIFRILKAFLAEKLIEGVILVLVQLKIGNTFKKDRILIDKMFQVLVISSDLEEVRLKTTQTCLFGHVYVGIFV